MTKIVVIYSDTMAQVFDSMYGVLIHLKKEWNIPTLTLDVIKDKKWQNNNEILILESEYFPMGDSGSVGEELLVGVPEIEQKCRVVRQCVRDLDSSLEEALEIYGVTREQYRDYIDTYDTN